MARQPDNAAVIRSLLLKLTAADWSRIRALAPELEQALRHACKIHKAQAVFDPAGTLTPLVLARLRGLQPQDLLIVAGAMASAAETAAAAAVADAGKTSSETRQGGQATAISSLSPDLAEVMAQSSALVGKKRERTTEPEEEQDDRQEVLSEPQVTRLQELLATLNLSQERVMAAVERMLSRVQRGAAVDHDDLAQIQRWHTDLEDAALALNREPREFDLPALGEAVAAALREQAADAEKSELSHMLAEIAAAEYEAEAIPSLKPVIEQARAADPRAMPEEAKAAFRALHRIMSAPLSDANPQDAETVHTAFGMPVLLGAANALCAQGHQPPKPEPPAEAHVAPPPAAPIPPVTKLSAGPAPLAEPAASEFRLRHVTPPRRRAARLLRQRPRGRINEAAKSSRNPHSSGQSGRLQSENPGALRPTRG